MMHSRVEAVGTCRIVLSFGFVLDLERTFYVPSFSKNLISVSRLVQFGYSFNFSDPVVKLFYKSDLVGNGGMSDDLFQIIYKTMLVIIQCMFKQVLKDVL